MINASKSTKNKDGNTVLSKQVETSTLAKTYSQLLVGTGKRKVWVKCVLI